MSKWLKITIAIILTVAILGMSIWFIFFSGILDKTKKYSYQDIQDMYDAGFVDGSKRVTDLQLQIDELNGQIELNYNRITELQDLARSLSSENSRIPGLETEIENLRVEKAELLDLVNRLQAELEIYCNDLPNRVIVTFYKDNNVYKELSIRENGSVLVEVPTPIKDGYLFNGWSLNNEIIDITTYSFTQDERLDAVFVIDDTLSNILSNLNHENYLHFKLLDNSIESYFYFTNDNLGFYCNGYFFDNIIFLNNNSFIGNCVINNDIFECHGNYNRENKQLQITLNDIDYNYYYIGIVEDMHDDYLRYLTVEPSSYLSNMILLSYDNNNYFGYEYKPFISYSFEDIDVNEVKKIIFTQGVKYVSVDFLDNFVNLTEIDFYGTAMQWFGQHTLTGRELIDNFKINKDTSYIVNCIDGLYEINNENKVILKFYAPGKLEGYSNITFENLLYYVGIIDKNNLYLDEVNAPNKQGYNFVGWSDGQNIIDFYTYSFDSSTNLYAEYEQIPMPDGKYRISCEEVIEYGENSSRLTGNVTFIVENGQYSIDSSANNYVVVETLSGRGIYVEGTYSNCRFQINSINQVSNSLSISASEVGFSIQFCYCTDESTLNTRYFNVSNKITDNWYYTNISHSNVNLEVIDLY